ITVALGDDLEDSFLGETSTLQCLQADFDGYGQTGSFLHVPAQQCLGSDLVDVLPPRTSGARETPGKFLLRYADAVVDFEHIRMDQKAGSGLQRRLAFPAPSRSAKCDRPWFCHSAAQQGCGISFPPRHRSWDSWHDRAETPLLSPTF